MDSCGEVRFERDDQDQLTIVLMVQGIPIARSRSPANIAAEVAFRDLRSLVFNDALVVAIPTDARTLVSAAIGTPQTPEIAATVELISACAW